MHEAVLNKTDRYSKILEERFRFFAENVSDVLFIEDINFNLIYVSPSVRRVFGYEPEDLFRIDKRKLMTPESYERALSDFTRYSKLAQKDPNVQIPLMQYEYIRKDGSTFWGEIRVGFFWDRNGNLAGSQGVLRDIDERKETEEALRESQFKFQSIFELSPQAICLTEMNSGKIRDVNKKFCEIAGFTKEEVIGRTGVELGICSTHAKAKIFDLLRSSGQVEAMPIEFRTRKGEVRDALAYSRLITIKNEKLVLSIIYDVTDQNRLQAMLRQAQKMEAVGTLAGGIAHDFNNLLQGILGFAQVLQMDKDRTHPDYDRIKAIEEMVQKGADLTRRLLIFARRVNSEPQPLDLNDEIREVCKLLKRAMPRMIEMDLLLAPDIRAVHGDRSEIEQILMNLCLNARDAMPEGGRLTIQTQNVILEEDFCKSHPGSEPGEYVLLRITDTGEGIEESLLEHIFEPFFTTKDTGKGTGLGLAIVYSIVKSYGGYISCRSRPGHGTTFEIYFPVSNHQMVLIPEKTTQTDAKQLSSPTILVVDDEGVIIDTTRSILEHYGYDVISAMSGEEAIEIFREHGDHIDLVLLDLGMPGMGGKACLKHLRQMDPNLRVIIASGYCPGEQDEELMEMGIEGIMPKPYKVEDLLKAVQKARAC